MAESQNYKCKICKRDCKFLNSNLADSFVVDHCHTTGVVRGLLCGPCNRGIGMFNDNPDFLMSAVAYLS